IRKGGSPQERGGVSFFDNNRFSGCCQKKTRKRDKLFFMHGIKNSLNAHKMTITWSQSTAK
ncbi:hypothetical protein, partial [Acinetobacter sp. WU_MDCI_Abxc22]|uniref:hypothetical protein n=1 Tax=Acinetobacter sp. WU_MDCI_Abxc22 TaxID=2850071 RepID=UPI0021CDB5F4